MMPCTKVTFSIEFEGREHVIVARYFRTEEDLRAEVRSYDIEVPDDTIAYTDTWNNDQPNNRAGNIFLLEDGSVDSQAHEAAHMALGIMSRHGYENIICTTDNADNVEELFCELVGRIADALVL